MNTIEIKNLTKNFKDFKLGPIDLNIPKGSIVGFIGENGAGKSTTIKLILNLLNKDSGDIKIFGKNLHENHKEIMNDIGVVFDDLNLPKELAIKDYYSIFKGMFENWDEEKFFYYMKTFQLPENRKIKELSRGMKMKFSLAIALSHNAKLMIMDEPTSGLDPVARDEILDILLEFIQSDENTVFISSHILTDLQKVADYIAFIHKGQLKFMEEKDALTDEFAILQCDKETAISLSKAAIIGRKSGQFGEKLLVRRELVPSGLDLERPSIEDIMLFFIRGEGR
ncbi:MAG: ABC transporter ATP-binding protein [Tissierellia bacterium]|nr:ABC transporter ATP-binding protein [Tissierellia bacterium]